MSDYEKSPDSSKERSLGEGILQYVAILFRHRWLVSITTVLAAVVVLAFSIISIEAPPEISPLPNLYTSSAILLMQTEKPSEFTAILSSLGLNPTGRPAATGLFDDVELAIRVLKSNPILDQIAEDFDIKDRYRIQQSVRSTSRRIILQNAGFRNDRTTRTLTINYTSIDPVFSRNMVQRLVELLNSWFLNQGGTSRSKQKLLLEEKLLVFSTEITKLEDELATFQRKYGVLTVDELVSSQVKILSDLRSQLTLKEIEIKNYSQFSKIEDPILLRLKSERNNIADQIRNIDSGLTDSSGTITTSREDLPELSRNFINLSNNLKIQRRIYEALSQQYEVTKLRVESEPVFQILQQPEVADKKSAPSRPLICIAATSMALIGSIILTFLLNYVKKLKQNPMSIRRLIDRVQ